MDGIIFDVDGTLWDSTESIMYSWNKTIRENSDYNIEVTRELLMSVFGLPLCEIFKKVFLNIDEKDYKHIGELCIKNQNDYLMEYPGCLYEGIVDVIIKLSQKYRVFIVSNCEKGYIETLLHAGKLYDYITDYTCPGETGKLKGDNIRIIMKRNHIKKAVYIGDTNGDAMACKEAGVPFIFVKYGFGDVNQVDYNACINSFKELLQIDFETFY